MSALVFIKVTLLLNSIVVQCRLILRKKIKLNSITTKKLPNLKTIKKRVHYCDKLLNSKNEWKSMAAMRDI